MTVRCACGYPAEYHEVGTRRCPLCNCGLTPDQHGRSCTPPAPLLADGVRVVTLHCVNRERNEQGALPVARYGVLRVPASPARRQWFGMSVEVDAQTQPEVTAADRVPRRPAQHPDEIAPAALKFGRKATAAGCTVEPFYRELHDGRRRCILKIWHEESAFRAVAIWGRTAEGKWTWQAGAHGDQRTPAGAQALGELISALAEGKAA